MNARFERSFVQTGVPSSSLGVAREIIVAANVGVFLEGLPFLEFHPTNNFTFHFIFSFIHFMLMSSFISFMVRINSWFGVTPVYNDNFERKIYVIAGIRTTDLQFLVLAP